PMSLAEHQVITIRRIRLAAAKAQMAAVEHGRDLNQGESTGNMHRRTRVGRPQDGATESIWFKGPHELRSLSVRFPAAAPQAADDCLCAASPEFSAGVIPNHPGDAGTVAFKV